MKYFCDPFRLPVGPSISWLTKNLPQNSTLRFQLIKIFPYSLSTASNMRKWLRGGDCISFEHYLGNPFSHWSTNILYYNFYIFLLQEKFKKSGPCG